MTEPEIYILNMSTPLDENTFEFFLGLSDEERQQKVLRQGFKKNADIRLVSHILAKCAIKKSFGIDIKNQSFKTDENQKPYLENFPDVYFNLSHSGDFVACAVFDGEVGIDIQKLSEYKEKTAKRICSKNELSEIEQSENKDLKFTEIWTKKEAYLKYLGTGIKTLDLKDVLCGIKNHISTKEFGEYVITVVY